MSSTPVATSKRAKRRAVIWRATQIIKATRGCQDCGYNKHSEALQFDHIDDNKKGNVSNLVRSDYGWETIKAEMAKCEVVCANCHAIRSAQRREDVKNLKAPNPRTLWQILEYERLNIDARYIHSAQQPEPADSQ